MESTKIVSTFNLDITHCLSSFSYRFKKLFHSFFYFLLFSENVIMLLTPSLYLNLMLYNALVNVILCFPALIKRQIDSAGQKKKKKA